MSDNYKPRHLAAAGDETPVEYQKPVSMMFSNRTYDKLKWIAQILLPAVATLYGTIGFIWGLPEVDKVVATIAAADFFLGALLGISTRSYEKSGAKYDGSVRVIDVGEDGEKTLSLNLDPTPDALAAQKEVTLKVNTE